MSNKNQTIPTANGELLTPTETAKRLGITRQALYARIKQLKKLGTKITYENLAEQTRAKTYVTHIADSNGKKYTVAEVAVMANTTPRMIYYKMNRLKASGVECSLENVLQK